MIVFRTIEWVLGWTTQSALALAYMRSLELLIICHFYLTLTCRVMHWTSEVTNRYAIRSYLIHDGERSGGF